MCALLVSHKPTEITLRRREGAAPIITQMAGPAQRPYLHPITAPDGAGVLTEDMPGHHPWQHGLYVGLHHVNGCDFWTETWTKERQGLFAPRALSAPSVDGDTVRWEVVTDWSGKQPEGPPEQILVETQRWTLRDHGVTFELDMEWILRADVDVHFGQHAYGGLFLRMPYNQERGGTARNDKGQTNKDAEGQRAKWVAVSMPVAGRDGPAGIAIMDHPQNAEHPVPWRVDGQLGIAPSRCIAGEWHLKSGAEACNRYRVVVFNGETDADALQKRWEDFAKA